MMRDQLFEDMRAPERKEHKLAGWMALLQTWREFGYKIPFSVEKEQYLLDLESRIHNLQTRIGGLTQKLLPPPAKEKSQLFESYTLRRHRRFDLLADFNPKPPFAAS